MKIVNIKISKAFERKVDMEWEDSLSNANAAGRCEGTHISNSISNALAQMQPQTS